MHYFSLTKELKFQLFMVHMRQKWMDMNIMMNCQMNQGTIRLIYAFQVQMVGFFFILLIYIQMLCFVHLSFQNPSPLAPFE